MYNFDPYNVLLAIAINIPQRLKTFVLQGHKSTLCGCLHYLYVANTSEPVRTQPFFFENHCINALLTCECYSYSDSVPHTHLNW